MKYDLTLLYVEDETVIRENFSQIFKLYFTNVITTDNGKSAIELYNKHHIDIAILDISIPELDGLEVAKYIREKDQDIQIIMMSAHSDKDRLLQAINLQLSSYIIKPVKLDELDSTLKKVISKINKNSILELGNGYIWNSGSESFSYKKQKIKITNNEQKILKCLCENRDTLYTACNISKIIFDTQTLDTKCNNVVQIISRFKKKMLNTYHKDYFFIDNIYGLGYKISS